jgi:hypothetical protein
VIQKLRERYGAKDVKKYYSKFDVAVAESDVSAKLEDIINKALQRNRNLRY